MITKAVAVAVVLTALALPAAPAKASASYYVIETDVVYTPYSNRQSIVGGPFDTWSDCSAMMRAEPSNYTPGESITYSCQIRY